VAVGGELSVECCLIQTKKRGGTQPLYPPFLEQLFGLLRVPWKKKNPALGGAVRGCAPIYRSDIIRSCQNSNRSSDRPAHILGMPRLFSGISVAPAVCVSNVCNTSYRVRSVPSP